MSSHVTPRISGGYVDMNRLTNSSKSSGMEEIASSPTSTSRMGRRERMRTSTGMKTETSYYRGIFAVFSFFMIVLVGVVLYFLFTSPNAHISVGRNGLNLGLFKSSSSISDVSKLPYVHLSKEVKYALSSNQPIVALESTIITHGMPFPENLETAEDVESVVRQYGAIPATIGVLNGVIHIGLTKGTLTELAQSTRAKKCGRRDLSLAVSSKSTCGTTVSATMQIAYKIGLPIFVTGGTGGVHQGVEKTWDVSADLTELGRTPVMVISAGVKSILDIPKTLERLETEEVTVLGFQTDDFPAFYTSESGQPVPHRIESALEAARLLHAHQSFGMDTGILVAVPVPKQYELDENEMKRAVELANIEVEVKGIRGKKVTPFLLKRVNELTRGKSLESNIALIRNNAKVGAMIAVEYQSLVNSGGKGVNDNVQDSTKPTRKKKNWDDDQSKFRERNNRYHPDPKNDIDEYYTRKSFSDEHKTKEIKNEFSNLKNKEKKDIKPIRTDYQVTVIGGAAVDIGSKKTSSSSSSSEKTRWASQTSEIGTTQVTFGGVARNVAEVLARLSVPPLFLSAVGDDNWGGLILDNLRTLSIDPSHVTVLKGEHSATFNQFLSDKGDLLVGLADMSILENSEGINPSSVKSMLLKTKHVFFDANIPVDTMTYLCELSQSHSEIILYHDPTSVEKSHRIVDSGCLDLAKHLIIKPNEKEVIEIAKRMYELYRENYRREDLDRTITDSNEASKRILDDFPQIQLIVSKGANGVSKCSFLGVTKCVDYPAKDLTGEIVSTTGAGDSLMGGYIAGRVLGKTVKRSIAGGMEASVLSMGSRDAISEEIDRDVVFRR